MNGNELADELEIAQGNNNADELIPEAITMLRQQQAEIAELKVMLGHYEDVYEGVVTHPVKELTLSNTELAHMWKDAIRKAIVEDGAEHEYLAEAILRKAQEK
jgi:hypothetical protein